MKPELQVGRQIEPDARMLVQFPIAPFVGLADASHGLGPHVAAVSLLVAVQFVAPDTMKPLLHVG
jgi:hypothetical protein